MVRLVFRPYTKLRRSICTLEPLQSSTRVSSGFDLASHSSPSFGSQLVRSVCASSAEAETRRDDDAPPLFAFTNKRQISPDLLSLCLWVSYIKFPIARAHVRLLGPCFKTGQVDNSLSNAAINSLCSVIKLAAAALISTVELV